MFIKIKNKLLNSIKKINDSYEFKPLLSEIEEAPVSPLGRFTFWTLVALIVVTTLWLFIGQVDIVVNARGIIVPDGDAKIIQPLDTGVVRQILIKEGDFVKKGQQKSPHTGGFPLRRKLLKSMAVKSGRTVWKARGRPSALF